MNKLNIKIVGLGEGGARAISKMISEGVGTNLSVEFLTVGNDENILLNSTARKNIFLNRDLPTVYKSIADAFDGAKVIFLVGGLASNAARAAIPIIMSRAKRIGAVTVAFVCRPFVLENNLRKKTAEQTLAELRGSVDTLFAPPAEKFFVFRINQPQISLTELFEVVNEIFCQGVEIFLQLIDDNAGLALLKWGNATFGYGEGATALDAIKYATKFPTLDADDIKHAEGVFVRLTSGKRLTLDSVEASNNFVKNQLQADAEFFSQEDVDAALGEKIFASIILTRNTKENLP